MAGNRGRFYVVLVIERPGDSPGASYAQFVECQATRIDGQLAYMQHMTAQMMTDLSKRVRRRPAATAVDEPPPQPQFTLDDDDLDDLEDQDDSDAPPAAVGSKRPHAAVTGAAVARSGTKPRPTEKTHLFVCTNPFALMDELNAATAKRKPAAGVAPMHYYMGVAAGSFDYGWMAERYCTLWGSSSRGAGPRASWGDALKTVHGVGMYVDIGVVFGNNVPVRAAPPPVVPSPL